MVHSSTRVRVALRAAAWYDGRDRDWRAVVQASNVGGVRAPRGPRVALAVALACWAVGAIVYAVLPEDSTARYVVATIVYSAGAAFSLACLARATVVVKSKERFLWGLLAAGLLALLVAHMGWGSLHDAAFGVQGVSYQHVGYLVS